MARHARRVRVRARRAIITSARSGAATASLPAPAIAASHEIMLADLARRLVDADRSRHRDRKTKVRAAFPPGGPRISAFTAETEICICSPLAT